jgi:hypothetical protein
MIRFWRHAKLGSYWTKHEIKRHSLGNGFFRICQILPDIKYSTDTHNLHISRFHYVHFVKKCIKFPSPYFLRKMFGKPLKSNVGWLWTMSITWIFSLKFHLSGNILTLSFWWKNHHFPSTSKNEVFEKNTHFKEIYTKVQVNISLSSDKSSTSL